MSLEQFSYLAQIVASVGVVLSLIFVGIQVRQSTAALQRTEHNSTMSQWTVIRMAILENRRVAELMTSGFDPKVELDAPDQLRLDMLLNEYSWASFHIWDRTRRGVFPPGTFQACCGTVLRDILLTPRGRIWWQTAPSLGLAPDFVADVDAILAES